MAQENLQTLVSLRKSDQDSLFKEVRVLKARGHSVGKFCTGSVQTGSE